MLRAARTLSARPLSVPVVRPVVLPASLMAAGLLATVLLGACSGGADRSEPAPVAGGVPAATIEELAALYAGDLGDGADPATATCFAEALAGRATLRELEKAGLVGAGADTVPTLPGALAEKWVAAQDECVDTYEELARAQRAFARGDLRAEEYAACLRAAVPAAELRAALVESLTGAWDGPAVTALATAQARCADQPG